MYDICYQIYYSDQFYYFVNASDGKKIGRKNTLQLHYAIKCYLNQVLFNDKAFLALTSLHSVTYPLVCLQSQSRALDHPIFGPKFGPIPNGKKYGFFSNSRQKFPI